jgi:hypothetical protein
MVRVNSLGSAYAKVSQAGIRDFIGAWTIAASSLSTRFMESSFAPGGWSFQYLFV